MLESLSEARKWIYVPTKVQALVLEQELAVVQQLKSKLPASERSGIPNLIPTWNHAE